MYFTVVLVSNVDILIRIIQIFSSHTKIFSCFTYNRCSIFTFLMGGAKISVQVLQTNLYFHNQMDNGVVEI